MKYYAIRYKDGEVLIVHKEWPDVLPLVNKKPGVVFKGFKTKGEARKWAQTDVVPFRNADSPYAKDVYYAHVDGSYTSKKQMNGFNVAGWGYVIVKNDKVIHEDCGAVSDMYNSRNITGELAATLMAVAYGLVKEYTPLIVVHDYIGISQWALGLWEPKSQVALDYVRHIKPVVDAISFEKVRGHQKVKWNEYADALAKKGIDRL